MFWHNFKYTLKIILRDHALIFWTLAFPLIMATLFNLAFSNLENEEKLSPINIAVIDDQTWRDDVIFQNALTELSQEGDSAQIFRTQYVSTEDATEMLADGEITGYLQLVDNRPVLTVSESNVDATIFKTVIAEVATQSQIIQHIIDKDPAKLAELDHLPSVTLQDESSEHLSYTMIEYYTLIAMICLYGGIIGMVATNQLLANMSASGKRIAVSPTPKWRLVLSGLLASYLVQLVGLGLLFAYTIGVLHVDYGTRFGLVVALSLLGALAGLSIGVAIASLVRGTENTKVGIMLAISMFGCFLAGMMGVTMKYIVDTNLPLLNRLNPANLITDGLYALYYYPDLNRFGGNMIMLALITCIIIGVSIYSLRKEQYDNL